MADSDQGFLQKFCLEFYESSKCAKNNCKYLHKRSNNVEVVAIHYDQGYIQGRHMAPLCRYDLRGCCKFGENCRFRHLGIINSVTVTSTIHPGASTANLPSSSSTSTSIELFVVQSKSKICGICLETVVEKVKAEQKFGILPNCTHCYCIKCICKWRKSRQFDNEIIKACPECRVQSDFVCPSKYWVEKKEDKDKMIDSYKQALSRRDCKYFRKGVGNCPFGNKCFYKHALPDGSIFDVGPPRQRRPRRDTNNQEFEMLQQVLLINFLRESPWPPEVDDAFDELSYFDSFDSDTSDFELYY